MVLPRNVRLLSWFNFWSDFRLYAPIAILYYSQISGSYALGMSVFSAVMLAQSIAEVPTGIVSDMVGRKRTVIFGAIADVLAMFSYALAGVVGGYPVLLIGAAFQGVARAFHSGNNDALLHDTLAEIDQREHFQEYLGKTSSMYQAALAVSAVIGSLIAAISFQIVMWLSVLPMIAALLVSLRFIEPKAFTREETNVYAHLGTAFRNIIHNPRLRLLALGRIISYAVGESTWMLRSAFVQMLWPVWALGFSQMIGNATASIGFYFAGRIIRRYGEFRLMVGGMTLSELINLFGLLVPTVFSPALMALNSVFFGINNTAIGGLLQREFSDEQRATMGSLTSFGGSLAFAVFAVILGALADWLGVIPASVIASLLSVIPISLYYIVLRPSAPSAAPIETAAAD